MKLSKICFIFTTVAGMPRIWNRAKFGADSIRHPGRVGMSVASLRSYFKEQHHRAANKRQINNLLKAYFQLRDAQTA